ncbi:MAG: glycosyltransferase family 2 protein [Thermodesulfobacteriota bacterium]
MNLMNSTNPTNSMNPAYIVITPVRDEVKYVGLTFESMISQTVKPVEWIIVDDGSTDGTGELLDRLAGDWPCVRVIHRPNRGFRKSGGGVIEAFNEGYAQIREKDWEFLVKLDGDLSFEPDYFERCLEEFYEDPSLGLGGGTVCVIKNGRLEVDSKGDPPFHVRGATKIYRRACWEVVQPLVQTPGWDTIDEVKANMYGWKTRTFPQIRLLQHKPTGSGDGNIGNWAKNGLANFHTGYHPIFMIGKCVKRGFQKPRLEASLGLLLGFLSGYVNRTPRSATREVVQYLRRQQINFMLGKSSIYSRENAKR